MDVRRVRPLPAPRKSGDEDTPQGVREAKSQQDLLLPLVKRPVKARPRAEPDPEACPEAAGEICPCTVQGGLITPPGRCEVRQGAENPRPFWDCWGARRTDGDAASGGGGPDTYPAAGGG